MVKEFRVARMLVVWHRGGALVSTIRINLRRARFVLDDRVQFLVREIYLVM